ncbi:hemerythrin domain-containing protein [Afifella pfennigii]|uniref:hemerythrin domain-containing protein n=1 Tax=Afifella pfennigii TaxID=209897 RepID=UPI00068A0FC0|nr:hemerythrin domain-containing protein [Afifella pfennigii]
MPPQKQQLEALIACAAKAPAAEAIRLDPFQLIAFEHALQERLCDLLEAIADALPNQVLLDAADAAATTLRTYFPAHLKLENDILFPALTAPCRADRSVREAIALARSEHDADEASALELAEALANRDEEGRYREAEALGYLLRSFFEQQRRHIAWEETVVFPMARSCFSAASKADLAAALLRHRMRCECLPLVSLLAPQKKPCNGNCADCEEKPASAIA